MYIVEKVTWQLHLHLHTTLAIFKTLNRIDDLLMENRFENRYKGKLTICSPF